MKIYLILLFLCFGYSLSAQTFIGPSLTYDFATIETQRIFREGMIADGRWNDRLLIQRSSRDNISGRRSIAFGFQVQKMLSKQWSLGLRGSYSKKQYWELIDPHIGLARIDYKILYQQIGLSILFSRKIKNKVSIGIGPNISYFTDRNQDILGFEPYQDNKRAYGADFQLGYYLGPLYLSVDYTKILKVVDSSGYMTGASSLAISGTYFFKIRKRK